jgi:PAS domain S-box-containing protein
MPLVFFIWLIFVLMSFSPSAFGQVRSPNPLESKNVLILHSHEGNAPVFIGTDKGLSGTLQSAGIPMLNQFFESLDLRRNPGSEHRQIQVEGMRVRYGQRQIDMIITMYPEALEFLLQDGRDIFPAIPILALYLPQDFEFPKTERRIIGHSASLDVIGTLEIALKLVPGAKRIYVVSGAHEVDKRIENLARSNFKKWESQLEFRYLSGIPFENMLVELSTAPLDTIILLLIYSQDVTGRSFTSPNLAQQLSQVATAPIFGLLEAALGYGIVGGSLISFERIGDKAGELALDILKGNLTTKNIADPLEAPPVSMFDWRQLRRWKLDEDALPEGTVVVNREFTFWDLKYYAIGALAFIMAQSFLIAGLLVQKRRKRSAEESLRQKTEELDRFFSVTLDLLCIANTEGYFLRLNPAWESILGYSREELSVRQFFDFVHPDDLAGTREVVSRLASQQEVIHFENRYRCKDGTYRWLEWTSAPAGELIYAAARDITERLKEEFEARQHREELAHVARVAMMGELTTSLAHEISQPLTAILSNAEAAKRFLSQASPDISEVRQILEDIIRDDRRARQVIQKVRALVRKEKPRQEFLNLNDVIREIVALIRGESLLQGLSIAMELAPDLQMTRGDRIQLQQVILNLILNSAAAMRTTPSGQRKMIVRTAMQDSGTVRASVTDFGTGIDANNIDRLFEPFYTTKPEGLGMGLSISQTIINAHGGAMEAWNNREGGATFAFTLPADQGNRS